MKTRFLMGLLAAPLMIAVMAAPAVAKKKAEIACADGTTSTAKGRGACSGHGGVKKDGAAEAPAKAAPAAPAAAAEPAAKAAPVAVAPAATRSSSGMSGDPANATAKCKDGTYSHAVGHKGACSRHGGVEEWLKK
jgi:hypothetical protein